MKLVDGSPESHSAAIVEILNDAILNSTALYEYRARSAESMTRWFQSKEDGRFPVTVALDHEGAVRGFATYGSFRSFPAYKYTIEHSVYVHRDHRGRGVGTALMRHLIAHATSQGYHAMVGVVDGANQASVSLHERMGFVKAGVIRQAGFKFGRWLDAVFYQLLLPTPENPVDG